ncbi:sensor histidine kinase [Sedimenticola hydrogenitrophicus]|uniref:sensor histidine kinase n=1 Tax=Sedimenticola hydrogenitrophicus TaxID=2967975 RepID=UPI0021A3FBA1|nr:histidine kinase [Sedimenticola hydrogenitrophicus]
MTQKGSKGRAPERGRAAYLPNFCSVRMVFGVVISAELLAVIITLVSIDSFQEFAGELSLRSLYIQWIALMGSALICLSRPWISQLRTWQVAVISWCLLMLASLVISLLAIWFLDLTGGRDFLFKSLVISAIVCAVLLHYLSIQYRWRLQVEAESRAHLQALQSRIRPHFLFNSMNTIASLTRTDPALAEEVVYDLSDLFRASLADAQRMSSLGEEIELCRGYLRIEGQRLGERLQVKWDLEALPLDAELPALILQPLLENAIYHGIEPSTEPGRIQITGRYRRKRVNISIRNSLPVDGGQARRAGNRMALQNIRERLRGFFDEEAALSVGEVDGEHQVRVVFPHPWKEQ